MKELIENKSSPSLQFIVKNDIISIQIGCTEPIAFIDKMDGMDFKEYFEKIIKNNEL